MKKIAKVLSVLMVIAMLLSVTGIMASAAPTTGSITITNAAISETYTIVKLFDAVVSGTADGPIVYTGTIPTELSAYFSQDANGYITSSASYLSEEAIAAMTTWAKAQTVPASNIKVADSDKVVFNNLPFGYYVVISSQGAAISVDSTNPDVKIEDKNSTEWRVHKNVNDSNVDIGQTVEYTLGIHTANFFYNTALGVSEKVTKYVIHDTLPDFLSDVTVTSIKIADVAQTVQQFNASNEIVIPWVDASGNHLYSNESYIEIKYTAVVTQKAVIDGDGNTNEMTVSVYVKDGDTEKKKEEKKDHATIHTYALALQKVDNHNVPLVGAEFNIYGLTVSGEMGNYTVVSYNAVDAASNVPGTKMVTDNQGQLIIKGLSTDKKDPVVLHEAKAPAGYNLLAADLPLTPTPIMEAVWTTETITYYDADGNVTSEITSDYTKVIDYNVNLKAVTIKVINNPGQELPQTGGMGTTMFILFGSFTALAFAVVLVARKKTAGYR